MSDNQSSHFWRNVSFDAGFYFAGLQVWRFYFILCNDLPVHLTTFTHAWRLDISMVCGVLLISVVLSAIFSFLKPHAALTARNSFMFLIWLFISITEISSALLYPEWGTTLDARAFSYLSHPGEVWASVSSYLPVLPVLSGFSMLIGGFFIIHKYAGLPARISSGRVSRFVQLFIFVLLAVLGLRGGVQKLPVTPAAAVGLKHPDFPFSRNMFDNDSSRIACWSTDVYAACTHDLSPEAYNHNHMSNQALLYQNMIRKWLIN